MATFNDALVPANIATVKGASTAPLATDMAIVVSLSPNSAPPTATTQGNKTNNNAAPGATNVGALTALANAAPPASTEGNLVTSSVDLIGNQRVRVQESSLAVTATAAANTGFTLTLPAAGAGLFHYITSINIMRNATAGLVGSATLIYTTTNLPGSLAWSIGNSIAAGDTKIDVNSEPCRPLKSSVSNTATTIVAPACGAAVLCRVNVQYYTGP